MSKSSLKQNNKINLHLNIFVTKKYNWESRKKVNYISWNIFLPGNPENLLFFNQPICLLVHQILQTNFVCKFEINSFNLNCLIHVSVLFPPLNI